MSRRFAWKKDSFRAWLEYKSKWNIDLLNAPEKTLGGSSANCEITSLNAIGGEHFVKCQVRETADDILNDIVNNVILEFYLGQVGYEKYITKIIACVQSPVVDDLLIVNYSPTLPRSPEDPYPIPIPLSLPYPIPSPTCIQKQLYAIELDREVPATFRTKPFHIKIVNLFLTLFFLGRTCWFLHNDAHLGNIMVENATGQLVLIDYGRCLFHHSKVSTHILAKAVEFKKDLGRGAEPFNYNLMMDEAQWLKPHQSGFLQDISTITMNILTKKQLQASPIFYLDSKIEVQASIHRGDLDVLNFFVPFEVDDLEKYLLHLIRNMVHLVANPDYIYLPGLYIFILMIYQYKIHESELYTIVEQGQQYKVHRIKFGHNAMRRYIYYSFQYFEPVVVPKETIGLIKEYFRMADVTYNGTGGAGPTNIYNQSKSESSSDEVSMPINRLPMRPFFQTR